MPEGNSFVDRDLADAEFRNVSLKGARFEDVSLAGARFDDIDFSGAEIGRNCNFAGMTVAGVPLAELFDAYRKQKAGRD
ncbi:Pentapeptide repeat-containing protein [Tistlia consotensis]|uniref:Pentapeptide repeat-containing protein n=1 Tax=Tistlia consotensis USBA 355 TaxID=560819 RepID=A0A1Y6B2W0_9PROT|nr:pentapeptide repeat-containing protein [Tistlia consotensis]SME88652.1 Pentapeptide repeat-containing protein [Tistlia consotensis USBA 355]SNR25194.1 Pentapeptide repeat-containing protein [Tistlia consotensis]